MLGGEDGDTHLARVADGRDYEGESDHKLARRSANWRQRVGRRDHMSTAPLLDDDRQTYDVCAGILLSPSPHDRGAMVSDEDNYVVVMTFASLHVLTLASPPAVEVSQH